MKVHVDNLFQHKDWFEIMEYNAWHPKTIRECRNLTDMILANPTRAFSPFFENIVCCDCCIELSKAKFPSHKWAEEGFNLNRKSGLWVANMCQVTGDGPLNLIQ